MTKITPLSYRKVTMVVERNGFLLDHQTGSHMIYKREGHPNIVSIPKHSEIAVGMIRTIMKNAGKARNEFINV